MDKQSHKEDYDARYAGDYMDADAYTKWVHGGLAAQRVRETLQQVPIRPERILDYGCGQGKWIGLLRDLYPTAAISGIDVSEVAVEKAEQRYPACQFSAFDGERAPFDNSSFDLVFSFHVLEHVIDVTASIRDLVRLVKPGGFACIIFPCGNSGSFEDGLTKLVKDGRQPSPTGEKIFYFERREGHLRRLPSSDTIKFFSEAGMMLEKEFYSGQLYASLDWLVRGTGPGYINHMFVGIEPVDRISAMKLWLLHTALLRVNRFLRFGGIDISRPRPPLKRIAAKLVRDASVGVDGAILRLARRGWERRRSDRGGSVQYLILRKHDR